MERKVWEKIVGFVEVEKYPALPCPYCKTKSLHLDKASISYRKAICSGTTALIEEAHKQKMGVVTEAFNANVLLGVLVGFGAIASTIPREPAKFICFFKCQSCDMDVSATGTAQYVENRNKYSQEISPLIKVEYFTPPLPILMLIRWYQLQLKRSFYRRLITTILICAHLERSLGAQLRSYVMSLASKRKIYIALYHP